MTSSPLATTPDPGPGRCSEGLGVAEAGALGLAGTAALAAIDAAGAGEGESVLISGATGGVGAIAAQYAWPAARA